MITFYYIDNASCKQAIKWFRMNRIEVKKRRMEMISKKDLVHILSLTENGFHDILKREDGAKVETQHIIRNIHLMKFDEGVDFILKNLEVLRTPIIVDKSKLIIGFNSEDLRIFISRNR